MADDNIKINRPLFSPGAAPPADEVSSSRPAQRQVRATDRPRPGASEHKDVFREVVETVVFVVVLVLLLKSFVAEAFVIPTGSMAETLYGYQKDVTCPQCGEEFPVNCSREVEDNEPPLPGCVCRNCRYEISFAREGMRPSCNTGDRVLVAKFVYDSGLPRIVGGEVTHDPLRPFDVVVFKFPEQPQKDQTPTNYIKRLIGLSTQTIGIREGDIYVAQAEELTGAMEKVGIKYRASSSEANEPLRRQLHTNQAEKLLDERNPCFKILRKPVDKIMATSRLVYDNDHQAKDLLRDGFPARWAPEKQSTAPPGGDSSGYEARRKAGENEAAWVFDSIKNQSFHHPARDGQQWDWLRYRHILRGSREPQLIKDFMGYNISEGSNWVGDLIMECDANVKQAQGTMALELSKGVDRFQASWQLDSGICTLKRLGEDLKEKPLRNKTGTVEALLHETRESSLKKPGNYHLRFANVDERLTVWVDGHLLFGDGVEYDPPDQTGSLDKNDLEPASIGVQGTDVSVSGLKLHRDTYYTNQDGVKTMYVQPGHYLCLGDNSPQSSDSRTWSFMETKVVLDQEGRPVLTKVARPPTGGLVPQNLMLGRALVIYWPPSRFGRIK